MSAGSLNMQPEVVRATQLFSALIRIGVESDLIGGLTGLG